jgi:hypothetical protein
VAQVGVFSLLFEFIAGVVIWVDFFIVAVAAVFGVWFAKEWVYLLKEVEIETRAAGATKKLHSDAPIMFHPVDFFFFHGGGLKGEHFFHCSFVSYECGKAF